MNVLEIQMGENDADAGTIGDYLRALLTELWLKEESFSGKRPFGNSGWQNEVYTALVKADAVPGEIDGDGYLMSCETEAADRLVLEAIDKLCLAEQSTACPRPGCENRSGLCETCPER
jgi:hypothetical protein